MIDWYHITSVDTHTDTEKMNNNKFYIKNTTNSFESENIFFFFVLNFPCKKFDLLWRLLQFHSKNIFLWNSPKRMESYLNFYQYFCCSLWFFFCKIINFFVFLAALPILGDQKDKKHLNFNDYGSATVSINF